MGSQTIRDEGFPLGQIKGQDYFYFPGIEGGKGGGGPTIDPAPFRYMYWPIKINPFSVRNNKIALLNQAFKVYDNVTPDGLGQPIVGTSLDYDLLLAAHAPVSDSIAAAGVTGMISIPAAATFPIELVYNREQIPQPTLVGYERRVWAIIDLRSTGRFPVVYVGDFPAVQNTVVEGQRMDTQVVDFEERI